jgi:hypothetical protein
MDLLSDYTGIMRRFLFSLGLFFSVLTLQAQEFIDGKPVTGVIFPLALVLEWAEYASEGLWKPDWLLEIPPDAFKVNSGEISACEIKWDDFSLGFQLNDEAGRVGKFPLILNGKMAQAAIAYRGLSEVREITVTFPSGDDPWKLEFLEYRNSFPYLVRAYRGDTVGGDGLWYFIYFSWGLSEILETWYDEKGNALGAYGFSLADVGKEPKIRTVRDYPNQGGSTELFYDSRELVAGASGPAGFFNVLYFREDFPRYWEYRPAAEDAAEENDLIVAGNFTLQWDETGLLRRLSGEDDNSNLLVDFRYEYTLDERGNWVERRETRMIKDLGLLVPSGGTTFKRVLEYKN